MKAWLAAVAIILVAWMQVSWFGYMRPLGVIPNLVLVVVVALSLRANATPSLVAAVVGGWVLDALTGDHTFGLRIGFYVMVSLAIIAARQLGVQVESALSGLVAVAAGSVLYGLAILMTLGEGVPLTALAILGRETIVNVTLAALIYVIQANIGSWQRTSLELGAGIRL